MEHVSYDDNNIEHVRIHKELYKLKERVLRRAILDRNTSKHHLNDIVRRLEGKTAQEIKDTNPQEWWDLAWLDRAESNIISTKEKQMDNQYKIGCDVEAKDVCVPIKSLHQDNWKHRSKGMKCSTCMWFVIKIAEGRTFQDGMYPGRCRRHAPSMGGWPVMRDGDWCGDHRLDENKA